MKLVEIAISTHQLSEKTPFSYSVKNHTQEVKILEEMSQVLEKVKMSRLMKKEQTDEDVQSIWAWMSGMEMLCLALFVLVQLASF